MAQGNKYFREVQNESLVKHAVELFDYAFNEGFLVTESPEKTKGKDIVGRRLPCMLLSVLLMELEDRGITIYFDKESFELAKTQAEAQEKENKRWDGNGAN